ncbi:hypothetical protein EST38_g3988 [Candolleomyces aberdarensis]|uniref:Uncharacterized protein n=1 Tax=Candolleomyces aberdarensis TaxID=2316362 RepID=A0A4Q2DRM6_9AGAR|nr:hypothetical protein EST38_g3988 [Candolleomyces aberdarensis]
MFCNDDFAIYLNPEGAHAVKIPELLPLEGGQIIFSSFEETRLTPTFSLQYPNSHSFTGGFGSGNIVFPAVYQPDRPLLFLVWEIVTDEMIHGYWYQFDVNRSNPQESTLKMVGSFRLPTLHLSAHNIHVYHGGYHPCGDRAAILWVHQSDDELDSLLFSFSSPTTIGPSPFSESSSGTRSESTSLSPSNDNTDSGPGPEVAATETSTLQLVHIMDGPVDRIEPRFCPTAGQLAILWTSGGAGELDSEEPHQRIQLYNFDS